MRKIKCSLELFGLKKTPFDDDRVNANIFEDEGFYDMFYQSPTSSEIISKRDSLQLITGYPGTGKSMALLYVHSKINDDPKDRTLSVYMNNKIVSLVNPEDFMDSQKHLQNTANNIVSKIWVSYMDYLRKHNKEEILKKVRNSGILKKFLGGIYSLAATGLRVLLTKYGFKKPKNFNENDVDTSLDDVLNTIKSIQTLSSNFVSQILLIFDDMGEYIKTFRLYSNNPKDKPYLVNYIAQLRDADGLLLKIAVYPENYQDFINSGIEDQHLHLVRFDPQFKTARDYQSKIDEFYTLTMNMYLKRYVNYQDKKYTEYGFVDKKLKLFSNSQVIHRICAFSNFNPRTALKIASYAFRLPLIKEVEYEYEENDDKRIVLRGSIITQDRILNSLIKSAGDRYGTFSNTLQKFAFGNNFINILGKIGCNYFTLPYLPNDSDEQVILNFIQFFEEMKRNRAIFRYPQIQTSGSDWRQLYGVSTLLLYYWYRGFREKGGDDLNKMKEIQGFAKLYDIMAGSKYQSNKGLFDYFKRYDFTIQEVYSSFRINKELNDLGTQLDNLINESKKIDNKLQDPNLEESKEDELGQKSIEIKREIRRFKKLIKDQRSKQKFVDEKKENLTLDEYGETEKEDLTDPSGKLGFKVNSIEFIKFFKGYSKTAQNCAKKFMKILETIKKEITIAYLRTYIRIYNSSKTSIILIKSLKSGINIYIKTPSRDLNKIYNSFPSLENGEPPWQWSTSYGSSYLLWIKIRNEDMLDTYKKSFLKLINMCIDESW